VDKKNADDSMLLHFHGIDYILGDMETHE